MTLNEYTSIPSAATVAGAPIDAFLLRTLRENDVFAEKRLRSILASPFAANGAIRPAGAAPDIVIGAAPTPLQQTFCYNAKSIELNANLTTEAAVPLVWVATEEIRIQADIDATGKGALRTKIGNFGGAGGARNGTNAIACELPLSGVTTATGGVGPSGAGQSLDERWASRIFVHLAGATGGGVGAGAAGGLGGGIVILCAPKITIGAGKKIRANGQNGANGASAPGSVAPAIHGDGGGGGGLIVLITNELVNPGGAASFEVLHGNGGLAGLAPGTAGGNGGDGRVLTFTYA